jgi:uncharacterized protein (TIRG00374 family)
VSVSPPVYQRKWFQLLVGLIVTAVCLGWAFYAVAKKEDPATVLANIAASFRQADYRTLPLLIALVLAFYWLKSMRWAQLLRPLGNFTTWQVFPAVMVGFAFNNLLPAHLGEFVRVFVFSRRYGTNQAAVLSTVVLERIFDILAILGFFFLGLAFTKGLPPDIQKTAWLFAGFVAVGLAGAAVYLVWTRPFVAFVEAILTRLPFVPAGLRAKVCGLMEGGAAGLASLKSGWLVAGIGLNSIVQWALNGLMMHIALWSFGIHVSLLASCLLLGVTAFAVTIPAAPGYFGVIQLAFVMVINQRTVGVANEPAVLAASIYYHVTQYVLVTAVGLVFFNRIGLSMAQVEHEAEARAVTMPPADSLQPGPRA